MKPLQLVLVAYLILASSVFAATKFKNRILKNATKDHSYAYEKAEVEFNDIKKKADSVYLAVLKNEFKKALAKKNLEQANKIKSVYAKIYLRDARRQAKAFKGTKWIWTNVGPLKEGEDPSNGTSWISFISERTGRATWGNKKLPIYHKGGGSLIFDDVAVVLSDDHQTLSGQWLDGTNPRWARIIKGKIKLGLD